MTEVIAYPHFSRCSIQTQVKTRGIMKLGLDLRTSLTQTLTPQQIQYLKLLQLPVLQLEQQVFQELEQNPMLEEINLELPETQFDSDSHDDVTPPEYHEPTPPNDETFSYDDSGFGYEEPAPKFNDDGGDPFEFYKMLYQDDNYYAPKGKQNSGDEEEMEPFQIKAPTSFIEDLMEQLRMLDLSPEEFLLGEHIIGNIDTDGYLRRNLQEIVDEANINIAEINLDIISLFSKHKDPELEGAENPAKQFAISEDVLLILAKRNNKYKKESNGNHNGKSEFSIEEKLLKEVDYEIAEKVLKLIQSLDPPGIASRSVKECLVAQCKALPKHNAAQKLALEILEKTYDAFTMKHYHIIMKTLEVSDDYLKEALDVIKRLNPKPGGGDPQSEINQVIPDLVVEKDEDTNELLISVNDSRLPALKLSNAYEKLKKEARFKLFNKDTRDWIRNKYEDAKFLIQAIRQRRNTMLKVMTAIAGLQKDFFYNGHSGLKPLIYKDVSETTGLDISTVCRIVNGKYVQTEYGTLELKYFFSESLPNEDGEEISTTVIKQIIKDIIESETKDKPFSDEKIADELKLKGYMVARRTVAKYREQLRIPVARLRKEL